MASSWTRRDLLRMALALPAGAWLDRYTAMAAPLRNKVKITAVKAMALRDIAGNCLIRIDTDAGLTGYGEAGSTGPHGARSNRDDANSAHRQGPAHHRGALPQYDLADAHLHGAHPPPSAASTWRCGTWPGRS